ncbi:hypothetical protein O181_091935 [Austropuccinia psidii MF-1]|uniref:CCHC-type domain-containing protein n=1 Tax=Austropuccinia psidii MF-1 TaxID=1389203 RepID=A0A9Q3IYQ7_9BASI|nr:hypothetical protein [Austropuccinia psidii MF-1]
MVNVEKDCAFFQVRTESKEEVALPADRETRSCYNCGREGHISKNCRSKNNNNHFNKNIHSRLAKNEEEEPNIAFVAINSKVDCALVANKKKQSSTQEPTTICSLMKATSSN